MSNSGNGKEPVGNAFIDSEYPNWSPDGESIIYLSYGIISISSDLNSWVDDIDSIGVWIINKNGNNRRKVYNSTYADWSPNGEKLLLEINSKIYTADFNGNSIDSNSIEQITFDGENIQPEWSPNGNYILFEQTNCSDLEFECGIWIFNIDENSFFLISNGGSSASWYNNSNEIVFRKAYGENGQTIGFRFYVYNLTTRVTEQILEIEGDSNHLKMSPIENKLAFSTGLRGENQNIWIFDLETKTQLQLTFSGAVMPDWSPDGSKIVYISDGIWVMNSDGSNKVNIKPLPIVD